MRGNLKSSAARGGFEIVPRELVLAVAQQGRLATPQLQATEEHDEWDQ